MENNEISATCDRRIINEQVALGQAIIEFDRKYKKDSFSIANGIERYLPDIEACSNVFKEEVHVCTIVGEIVFYYDSNKITMPDIDNYLDRLKDDLYKEQRKKIGNSHDYSFRPFFHINDKKVSLQIKEGIYQYCEIVLNHFYENFSRMLAYVKGKLPNGLVMDSAIVKYNANIQNKFEFKIPELLEYNSKIDYIR